MILNIFAIRLHILGVHKHRVCGAWNMKEKALYFNCKELLAVYDSLSSFKTYFQNKHVKIFSDSQLGVQIINEMKTTKTSICNDIVKNVWLYCVRNKIWILQTSLVLKM